MISSRRTSSGFTLIELVLVLLLLSVVISMAAPNMRGWSEGAKLKNAADDFVSAARWARNEAIVTASVQVLTISNDNFSVAPESRTGAEHPSPFNQPTAMPTDFTISLVSGGDGSGAIRFFPDGRITPGVVRITSGHNETIEIASVSPAIEYRVVNR